MIPTKHIIQDTRERIGWWYEPDDIFLGTISSKLEYGDYSIEGLEDKIFIDRKKSVTELARNIFEPRFENLLKNISSRPYRFIICEFALEDILNYPFGCKLPLKIKNKIKVRGGFLQSVIIKYIINYNINFIFAGDNKKAKCFCYAILKQIYKNYAITI